MGNNGLVFQKQARLLLNKPISSFIPQMIFHATVNDIQDKWEAEGLMLFREIGYFGGIDIALQSLKMFRDYFEPKEFNPYDEEE